MNNGGTLLRTDGIVPPEHGYNFTGIFNWLYIPESGWSTTVSYDYGMQWLIDSYIPLSLKYLELLKAL